MEEVPRIRADDCENGKDSEISLVTISHSEVSENRFWCVRHGFSSSYCDQTVHFYELLARPFLDQFSISLGLRNLKFREEFEYGIYTSIRTIFNSSNEPYFYPLLIIGPEGPFLFGSEEMSLSPPQNKAIIEGISVSPKNGG